MKYYRLPIGEPVPCEEHEKESMKLWQLRLNGYLISTVFTGMEDSLFETAIFKDDWKELYRKRCSSYKEAKDNHKEAIGIVFRNELI